MLGENLRHLGQKLVLHNFGQKAVAVAPLFLQDQLLALDLLQPLTARHERTQRDKKSIREYA